jgi:hypothetical protein
MRKARISPSLKQAASQRAGGYCESCTAPDRISPSPFAAEHILPEGQGGDTNLDNLAWSCRGCNNHKYTRTEDLDPETGILAPLYHPRKQVWSEHFAWSADLTVPVGITPFGRATIEALKLNRNSLINLRRLLRDAGEHPELNQNEDAIP